MTDGPSTPLTASGQHELLPMVLVQLHEFSSELGEHRKGIKVLEGQMTEATTTIREAANEIRHVGSKLGGFVTKPECEEIRAACDEERAETHENMGGRIGEIKREVCPSPAERRQRLGLWVGIVGGLIGIAAAATGVLFWLQGAREPAQLRLHPESIKQLSEEVLRQSKVEMREPDALSPKALAHGSGG